MESIGAIVLAAGNSCRLGRAKQSLLFRGQTLLARAIQSAVDANCSPVIVVLGAAPGFDAEKDAGDAVHFVTNAEWERGIGSSIRCGMRALLNADDKIDGVVILACDQPFLTAQTITALKLKRAETQSPIVASRYENTLGVPALFDRSSFRSLLNLEDEAGAKSLILARANEVAACDFAEGAIDIDTAGDYEQLLRKFPA